MARKPKAAPTSEGPAVQIAQPDFKRAISVLANDINPSEEASASVRGDLSAAWKVIEKDCHVNKGAAKLYNKLARMSDENRDDFLRSLYGLMIEAGIGISADLVDQAGGTDVPTMPVTERKKPALATLQ